MGIRTHRVTKTKRRSLDESVSKCTNDWGQTVNTGGYEEFGDQYSALKFIVDECKGVHFKMEEWKDANGWVQTLKG